MNERIKGIDVSKYQKTIDWDQVHAQGVEFAFARVTDGTKVVDEYFAANWRRMREAGIVRGVYQFFRASQSAVEQARLLVDLVNDAGGFERDDLPPVIDVEDGGCKGVEAAVVVAGVKAWLAEVERLTGKVPIVYTGVGLWSTLGALGADKSFLRFPLWVYHTQTTKPLIPLPWKQWHFWQYTHTGGIRGIKGAVDEDFFGGTLAELAVFAEESNVNPSPEPEPEPEPGDAAPEPGQDGTDTTPPAPKPAPIVERREGAIAWLLALIAWFVSLFKGKGAK